MPKRVRSIDVTRPSGAFDRLTVVMRRHLPDDVVASDRASGTTTIWMGMRSQLMAMGATALVVGSLVIATNAAVTSRSTAVAEKSAELARMKARLATMTSTTSALRGEVAERAAAIEKRQAFLAALLTQRHDPTQLAALLPRAGDTAAHGLDTDTLMAPFHKLEVDQLAFVDKATGAAEARLRDTQGLVRRLGLDPARLLAASDFAGTGFGGGGVGGPLLPVSAPVDAEPRFKNLFLSWKKLQALESALTVVPSYLPVKSVSYSSGFGVRFDPFTGLSALHAGVDLAGRQGEPIYAAAGGKVSLAGWSGAYGNCVEIAHGNGLSSRYGHLSAILVRPGDVVRQGDVIARMGSTGRSTGTHLHFEVRIDGRAVNPRPYLDASDVVLATQQRVEDAVGQKVETTGSSL